MESNCDVSTFLACGAFGIIVTWSRGASVRGSRRAAGPRMDIEVNDAFGAREKPVEAVVERIPRVPLHVALYEPEIAENTGAIGRTCVAAGAKLWLIRPLGFRLDDRRRKRAGLDYWEHLDLEVVDDFERFASAVGLGRLWLFSTKGTRLYTDVGYCAGDALVFGPESRGLPDAVLARMPERVVRIPMRPEARSLNLSSAAAVGIYECLRQLRRGESAAGH